MTTESRLPRRAFPGWLRGLALLALIALLIYTARQQQPPAQRPAAEESQPTGAETLPPKGQSETPTASEESPRKAPTTGKAERPASSRPAPLETEAAPATQTVIDGQTIRDQDGVIVHRGPVDVAETLSRIEAGERLRFPNDGATFQNRERRLPQQRTGYYREWVHPTPSLRGPGPQRIVTGQRGEIYYTPDHYRTFRRLDGG